MPEKHFQLALMPHFHSDCVNSAWYARVVELQFFRLPAIGLELGNSLYNWICIFSDIRGLQ